MFTWPAAQGVLSFSMCLDVASRYLVGPDRECTPHCVGAAPQSSSSAGPSLPPAEGKARGAVRGKRHAGACERGAVPDSPARRCSQHALRAMGFPMGTSTLCTKHCTGNGPCARRAVVSAARTAGSCQLGEAPAATVAEVCAPFQNTQLMIGSCCEVLSPETADVNASLMLARPRWQSRAHSYGVPSVQVHQQMTTTARLQRSAEM